MIWELTDTWWALWQADPCQELRAIHSNLAGERLTCTGALRQAHLFRPEAISGIPFQRHGLLHPGGSHVVELIEGPMHGFEDTAQPVECADGRQDMCGISPLRAMCLYPTPCFAGG
jgi:hypothetical protein